MSSQTPEEIRAEIERTRAALSNDVDALAEDAKPKNIAKRQVEGLKEKGVGLKDRIMGSVSDVQETVSDKVHDVAGTVSDKVHGGAGSASDTAHGVAGDLSHRAQGVAGELPQRASRAARSL